MAGDKKPVLVLTSDTLKNLGVALSICMTLFGVIKFAVAKIVEYDSHAARIAKLEARDSAVHALADNAKIAQIQVDANKGDIAGLKVKIDGMTVDITNLRLSDERIRTLLEKKR